MSASQVRAAVEAAFRDYSTAGVPASGAHEPVKVEIRAALGRTLEATLASISAGVNRYATVSVMNADATKPEGALSYVFRNNNSPTDPANGYYQRVGSVWEAAPWVVGSIDTAIRGFANEVGFPGGAASAGSDENHAIISTDLGVGIGNLQLLHFSAAEVNTGPLFINVDGTGYKEVVNDQGNSLEPGDAGPGVSMFVLYYLPGNSYVLVLTSETRRLAEQAAGLMDRVIDLENQQHVGADDDRFYLNDFPAASNITNTQTLRSVVRPIADANQHRYSAPGMRERCNISPGPNGGRITFELKFHGPLLTDPGVNPVELLVKGESVAVVDAPVPYDKIGYTDISADLDPGPNVVELVWPYGRPMSVVGRWIPRTATFGDEATFPRPTAKMVVAPDSISQGFSAEKTLSSWASLLAGSLLSDEDIPGMRMIDHGYGGRRVIASDGTIIGAEGADLAVFLVGANDVTAHTLLADYQAEIQSLVTNYCAVHPDGNAARIVIASQTWMQNGDSTPTTPPGADYRARASAAVAALSGTHGNLIYINGLTLTSGPGSTVDGTHPNNAAHATMAAALRAAIVAEWPELT